MKTEDSLLLRITTVFIFLFFVFTTKAFASFGSFFGSDNHCMYDGAVPTDSNTLLQPVRAVMQRLLANGNTQVGDFDIKKFLHDIEQIRVCFYMGGFIPAANGDGMYAERNTSIYFVEQKLVVLQRINWGWISNEDLLERVSLHESLGALGYIDDNYQLSMLLVDFSEETPATTSALAQEQFVDNFKEMPRRSKNVVFPLIARAGGGSTSTGGGGDSLSIEIKSSLFEDASSWVSTWLERLKRENICFGEAPSNDENKKNIINSVRLLILASEFESSNDPARQFESFTLDPSGRHFFAHISGILDGEIISSQLGQSFINSMKQQTYLNLEVKILYTQNPHPCNGSGSIPTAEQVLAEYK